MVKHNSFIPSQERRNQKIAHIDFSKNQKHLSQMVWGGGGGTPYNGLYREAPLERGTFFWLQVYKRVGISQVEVNKRVGKSAI